MSSFEAIPQGKSRDTEPCRKPRRRSPLGQRNRGDAPGEADQGGEDRRDQCSPKRDRAAGKGRTPDRSRDAGPGHRPAGIPMVKCPCEFRDVCDAREFRDVCDAREFREFRDVCDAREFREFRDVCDARDVCDFPGQKRATASTVGGRSPPPAPSSGAEWSGGRARTVVSQDGAQESTQRPGV